jgi:peptide/nickel transport system substrate-binding protein
MKPKFKVLTAVFSLAAITLGAQAAVAQKAGGVLKPYHRGTPPSGSIHEEATNSTLTPYMPVMNNLIMYDQAKATNSLDTIVPDLATSWSWSDGGKKLTFKLREGVKWHDGKPFTSAGFRLFARLSMPRLAKETADTPSRYRAIQVR